MECNVRVYAGDTTQGPSERDADLFPIAVLPMLIRKSILSWMEVTVKHVEYARVYTLLFLFMYFL